MPVSPFLRISANAYRTLGLKADASQEAIEEAVRRMRILSATPQLAATPNDLPWAGPLYRGSTQIEQAAANLLDPLLRVRERMLWFGRTDGLSARSIPRTRDLCNSDVDCMASHDKALLLLCTAVLGDSGFDRTHLWRQALFAAVDIAGSSAYLEECSAIEQNGGFEKPARREEIEGSIGLLREVVTASIVWQFERALDQKRFKQCRRAIESLNSSDTTAPQMCALGDGQRQILDHLEDAVDRRCAAIQGDMQPICGETVPVARILARQYYRQVHPLVAIIDTAKTNDPLRSVRIRHAAAATLIKLARFWRMGRRFAQADHAYMKAIYLSWDAPNRMEIARERGTGYRQRHVKLAISVAVLVFLLMLVIGDLTAPNPAPVSNPRIGALPNAADVANFDRKIGEGADGSSTSRPLTQP